MIAIRHFIALAAVLVSSLSCRGTPPANATELATLRGHGSCTTGVAFSPDGRRLVTGSTDTTAKVWDLTSGQELFSVDGHRAAIWSVAYSPDGRRFLTGAGSGDNNAKLWDADTGALIQTFPPLTDEADWLESGPFRQPTEGHGNRVEVVAFSPDGKRGLTGSRDGRVLVWDIATGAHLLTLGPRGGRWIHAAAFSPDGLTIAIGGYDGKITLWDASCGHESLTLPGHTNAIEFLAYFPAGGRIVTASHDRTARVWDTTTGRELLAFRGHQKSVTCVAVSPDGQRVATGCADGSGRVWNAATGREQFLLVGHKQAIDGIAFSPDGRHVATTSLDHTVKIWDVTPAAGPVVPGAATEIWLQSDYIPLGLRLYGDPLKREIRAVRLVGTVPPEGNGEGTIWLDCRMADVNPFGDVVRRAGPEPIPRRVELRDITKAGQETASTMFGGIRQAPPGFRLYDLTFPGGVLAGKLRLALGSTTLGPHRLLTTETRRADGFRSRHDMDYIGVLHGDPPITSAVPDQPLGREIRLDGYYTAKDGRIRRLQVYGTPGQQGTVTFDMNYTTFDPFGEPGISTLMGFGPDPVTLSPAEIADPIGRGRSLYWAISRHPRNTNRVAIVLGPTEAGPHRALLYQGDTVQVIVPLVDSSYRRKEVAIHDDRRPGTPLVDPPKNH